MTAITNFLLNDLPSYKVNEVSDVDTGLPHYYEEYRFNIAMTNDNAVPNTVYGNAVLVKSGRKCALYLPQLTSGSASVNNVSIGAAGGTLSIPSGAASALPSRFLPLNDAAGNLNLPLSVTINGVSSISPHALSIGSGLISNVNPTGAFAVTLKAQCVEWICPSVYNIATPPNVAFSATGP